MPTINPNAPTTPSSPATPTLPAPTSETAPLSERYSAWAKDGWTDGELKTYVAGIIDSGNVEPHLNKLWQAVLSPAMPSEIERDETFFEVLAWYIDKSTSGAGDGKLTLQEVEGELRKIWSAVPVFKQWCRTRCAAHSSLEIHSKITNS